MEQEKVKKTNEQKQETKKNVITGLVAFLAVAAVICVVMFYISRNSNGSSAGVIKAEVTSLSDITLAQQNFEAPFVQTDIKNVVYTADSAGNIKFYEFNGSNYAEVAESGNMNIQVPLSNQQIPVTIHYIERDGQLSGYGVFTSSGSLGIYIYNYMLCKITNLPTAYQGGDKCLLLASTNITDVYANNPIWEEAYVLNRSDGTTSRFLSENNRMVDINGAVRSDFCRIGMEELKGSTDSIPFFSSRAYDSSSNAPMDIYIKQGNAERLVASNVADTYAKPTDDGGCVFIRNVTGGFATVKTLNGQETTISEFYSEYGEEYIRSGDWLLCKEDGRIYATDSDKIIETPQFKINPTQFIVSDDGKYIVMAGTVANALDYQIYVYNTESGKCKTFADSDYSAHYNLCFTGATTVSYYTTVANGYNVVAIDISKIK